MSQWLGSNDTDRVPEGEVEGIPDDVGDNPQARELKEWLESVGFGHLADAMISAEWNSMFRNLYI